MVATRAAAVLPLTARPLSKVGIHEINPPAQPLREPDAVTDFAIIWQYAGEQIADFQGRSGAIARGRNRFLS